jgi:hypothetical protein
VRSGILPNWRNSCLNFNRTLFEWVRYRDSIRVERPQYSRDSGGLPSWQIPRTRLRRHTMPIWGNAPRSNPEAVVLSANGRGVELAIGRRKAHRTSPKNAPERFGIAATNPKYRSDLHRADSLPAADTLCVPKPGLVSRTFHRHCVARRLGSQPLHIMRELEKGDGEGRFADRESRSSYYKTRK